MRRLPALCSLLVLLALASPPAVAASEPYCGIQWGSNDKTARNTSVASLVDVRAGRHECFDRLVLDYEGRNDGFAVRYVSAIHGIGLENPVDLRGAGLLEIVVEEPYGEQVPPATTPAYAPADRNELVDVTGWRTFRQVAWVELWENVNTLGLGVRERLPFRAFVLEGPGSASRLVVDVAHQW